MYAYYLVVFGLAVPLYTLGFSLMMDWRNG